MINEIFDITDLEQSRKDKFLELVNNNNIKCNISDFQKYCDSKTFFNHDEDGRFYEYSALELHQKASYSITEMFEKFKNKSMSVSEKIDNFISENGGSERDALNVSLTRLEQTKQEVFLLKNQINKANKTIDLVKEFYDDGNYLEPDIVSLLF